MSEKTAFSLGNRTIERFLEELASREAAPGGGSAAAIAAAAGAALVSMVCRLTLDGKKYRQQEELLSETLKEADQLRVSALELASEDAFAYSNVMTAYRLPKTTEEEKLSRRRQIEEALKDATDVPLRTVALAARVLALYGIIRHVTNANASSDLRVGMLLANASLEGAALNATSNLELIQEEGFKASAVEELENYLKGSAQS